MISKVKMQYIQSAVFWSFQKASTSVREKTESFEQPVHLVTTEESVLILRLPFGHVFAVGCNQEFMERNFLPLGLR